MSSISIITGAGQGIGKAVAVKMAEFDNDIAIIDVNSEKLNQTAEEIDRKFGINVLPYCLDVREKSAIVACAEDIKKKYKIIKSLINCAGISTSNKIIDIPEEEWDRVNGINAKGTFLMCQAFAKLMINNSPSGATIVNISSQASKLGEYGNGGYSASKAAVNLLTQVLALEVAEYNINVAAICPGYVDTEMMREVFVKRGPIEGMTAEQYRDNLLGSVPMKRLVQPEEIAELASFLTEDRARYITGVTVTMAGGRILI